MLIYFMLGWVRIYFFERVDELIDLSVLTLNKCQIIFKDVMYYITNF